MISQTAYPLDVCVDCLQTAANGIESIDLDNDHDRVGAIEDGFAEWAAMDCIVVPGDSDDEGHFSWVPCDVCGDRRGGDRYAAHAVPCA